LGTPTACPAAHIVLVGDASGADAAAAETLRSAGVVTASPAGPEVERFLRQEGADLVVLGESVDAAQGLALVERLAAASPETPVVVVAPRADADLAVRFVRAGARDYFQGPLTEANLGRLLSALADGGAEGRRRRERFFAAECPPGVPLAGHSPGLRDALDMIRRVAASDLNPILIVGETGTGKELAAQAVHVLRGGRADDFVAVNCATLTATLLESELFGHVKGAFTGADRDKVGLFELAGDGTLFLDEISEMPSNLQAKLLRVLQEKKFRKVGGTRDIPCRATLIASSNRDLAQDAREGTFRPDLYYRLEVFPIRLPPLRAAQRRDDIPLLAEYFLATIGGRDRPRGLTAEARDRLLQHAWPGNVRELRNVIERALILEQGPDISAASLVLTPPALAPADRADPAGLAAADPGDFSLETAERLFITRALQETGWQRTRAAALLGITRATLHTKLKRYKITLPDCGRPADDDPRLGRESRLEEARA